jgi:hypothetical protein
MSYLCSAEWAHRRPDRRPEGHYSVVEGAGAAVAAHGAALERWITWEACCVDTEWVRRCPFRFAHGCLSAPTPRTCSVDVQRLAALGARVDYGPAPAGILRILSLDHSAENGYCSVDHAVVFVLEARLPILLESVLRVCRTKPCDVTPRLGRRNDYRWPNAQ